MEHDPFLQREELVQAHQLGVLQQDYTIQFGRQMAGYGVPVLMGLIAIIIFSVLYSGGDKSGGIIGGLVGLALYSALVGGLLYFIRGLHVYVYTGGLLYWRRKKREVIRWEQIRGVYRTGGTIMIMVQLENGPPVIRFPSLERQSELYSTIKHQVDSHRSSGQE